MKVTYNWLKDFVNIKINPQQLADKLTFAGLEVKSIEEKQGDYVFEIEITSNRPDWLSVIGVAREIAAITKSKIKSPCLAGRQEKSKIQSKIKNPAKETGGLKIGIQDKKDCPLYTARIIRGAQIEPSPDWLIKRLELIGRRGINNVVDITNYILFTFGEPLHAFDLDKLSRIASKDSKEELNIFVRRALEGEKIITIDGVERELDEGILVIAAGVNESVSKAVAIAGVMGGKETEVGPETKNILLEAAVFDPVIIRRARQKLGIQTDSSYRFERGVDFETVKESSEYAVKLINEIACGQEVLCKSSGSIKQKNITIDLVFENIENVLGIEIKKERIASILQALGFKIITKNTKSFKIEVPFYRQDVLQPVDLIEEVARIFGYENMPVSLPRLNPQIIDSGAKVSIPGIKTILQGLGLSEIITYSLIDRNLLAGWEKFYPKPLEILNPLSREQEILRPVIIPCMMECLAYNLNQKQASVKLFEIAKIYSLSSTGQPKEDLVLGIVLCGQDTFLFEQGAVKEQIGILHLKGVVEALFKKIGISSYEFIPRGEYFEIIIGGKKAGIIQKIQKTVLNNLDISNKNVFAAEILLENILAFGRTKIKYRPLPKYPGISRDISLVVQENVNLQEMLSLIKEKAGDLLFDTKITDHYKGRQIPQGHRGLTISCFYLCEERTLTDSEINPIHSAVCEILASKFNAKIR